ncbi:MAG: recombinase family protein [Solirubrobacteraceae bacterium]
MRVGLYARVSTERQHERGTIGSQLEALRAAADADGHEVIEEFIDNGYSGARLDRPALDRLRDAAEAGVLDGVLCLCVDRLARAYAYQVLILEELERFGVTVRFLEGPSPSDDPQATLLIQMQGVIAEYEKAKVAERNRRGKLYRARAGEIPFWKVSYGHRRVIPEAGGRARIEIFEPEAQVVREIFAAYVERGLSVRQIAFELRDRAIPSPTGKPQWGTSAIDRVLRNEAYVGTVYYNRHERIEGATRGRKTRLRERPREEWIAIPVPAIIDRDTFDRVSQVSHENFKMSPRGAAAEAWLLRGLIECGHCHVGCSCHNSYGRHSTLTRYYCCRNHDLLRAGSEDRLCPERNIRANELDEYVFEQVRQALLTPDQLLAAERAVLTGAPDENELVAAQLKHLDTAIETKERERARLLDAYQAGLLELQELTRRTGVLAARRTGLTREKETLSQRSTELAAQNRMRHRLAGFSDRVVASLDNLDFAGRRRLVRLVIEKVCVTGWRVEIHLKIPLPNEPPPDEDRPDHPPSGPHPSTLGPHRPKPPSSDVRLRSDHRVAARGDPAAADPAQTRARLPLDHRHLPGRDLLGGDHRRGAPPPRTDDARQRRTRALTRARSAGALRRSRTDDATPSRIAEEKPGTERPWSSTARPRPSPVRLLGRLGVVAVCAHENFAAGVRPRVGSTLRPGRRSERCLWT